MRRARQLVEDRFGVAVAAKATDRFLLAHGAPAAVREARGVGASAGWPSGMAVGGAVPTVLAFARPEVPSASAEAFVRMREQVSHSGEIALPALRQAFIRARREAAYARIGKVYDEVERLSERSWAGADPGSRSGAMTEVCWLSTSLRTRANPIVVADLAGDPAILAIDVPERLRREEGIGVDVVGAAAARQRLGSDGSGVLVGVIDGEVARGHPAFGDRVVHRSNHTDELWGSPDAHGTAVAGIIGGATDPGVAPGCTMYSYKVFATHSVLSADRFDGERAIQAALEDGVQVVNCSWAVNPPPPGQPATLVEAIGDAWTAGMLVVKSAGNDGLITYPGDAEGLVVVGTTTPDGSTIPVESGRSGSRPHLVAPGGAPGHDITSTLVSGGSGVVGWGTSYAAPFVTGALALLLKLHPAMTPALARDHLVATARKDGDLDPSAVGAGILDLSSW